MRTVPSAEVYRADGRGSPPAVTSRPGSRLFIGDRRQEAEHVASLQTHRVHRGHPGDGGDARRRVQRRQQGPQRRAQRRGQQGDHRLVHPEPAIGTRAPRSRRPTRRPAARRPPSSTPSIRRAGDWPSTDADGRQRLEPPADRELVRRVLLHPERLGRRPGPARSSARPTPPPRTRSSTSTRRRTGSTSSRGSRSWPGWPATR